MVNISKIILSSWVCFLPVTFLQAQEAGAFSSVGISLSASTTGFEFELAAPLQEKLILRGGVSFLPYRFSETIRVREFNGQGTGATIPMDMEGKIKLVNGKALLDFFPGSNSFFISGGICFGKKTMACIEGKSTMDLYWDSHLLYSENGRVRAYLKTNNIKPYIAIGFGNAIPGKRIGFRFEAGAMFHGTPALYNSRGEPLDDIKINDVDVIDTMNKIRVYPVIAFRLTGRIF